MVAVRIAAARALGQYRDPSTVDPLIDALADQHPMAKVAAIDALGLIGDPKALEPLRALLTRKGPGLYAARAIGRLRTPKAEAVLIEAVNSSDPWIRRGAIEGLAGCGGRKAADVLRSMAERPLSGLNPELLRALFPEGIEPTPGDMAYLCKWAVDRIEKRLAGQSPDHGATKAGSAAQGKTEPSAGPRTGRGAKDAP